MNKAPESGVAEVQLTFRTLEPTEALKAYAQKKAEKLLSYLRNERPPHMILATENLMQIAELEVFDKQKRRYFARAESENLYAAIDAVTTKIARQLDEAHKKTRDTRRSEAAKSKKKAEPGKMA